MGYAETIIATSYAVTCLCAWQQWALGRMRKSLYVPTRVMPRVGCEPETQTRVKMGRDAVEGIGLL